MEGSDVAGGVPVDLQGSIDDELRSDPAIGDTELGDDGVESRNGEEFCVIGAPEPDVGKMPEEEFEEIDDMLDNSESLDVRIDGKASEEIRGELDTTESPEEDVSRVNTDLRDTEKDSRDAGENLDKEAESSDTDTPRHELELATYINRGAVPPLYDRPGLLQYIQRLSIDSAIRGDYEQAHHYNELHHRFYNSCVEDESRDQAEKRTEKREQQIEAAACECQNLEEEWRCILADVEQEQQEKIAKLKEQQAEELRNFDAKWNSEFLRPFSKQSSHLTAIRLKERNLLLIKSFQEAAEMGKYARKIEREETRRAQKRAEREAIFRRRQMMAGHKTELQQCQARHEARITELEQKRDKEIEVIKLSMSNLKKAKGLGGNKWAETEWKVKMRNGLGERSAGVLSPRSHSRLDEYRKAPVLVRLDIRPVKEFPGIPKKKTWVAVDKRPGTVGCRRIRKTNRLPKCL
jgi:hypothetical protein